MERLDILGLHGILLRVTSVFLRLGQVTSDLCHFGSMVAEHQTQLLAL
jgi:hypothetical protein